jgi:hypothetical protein
MSEKQKQKQSILEKGKALIDKLIGVADNDSSEADQIRDELDPIWYALNEADQKELGAYSASQQRSSKKSKLSNNNLTKPE